MRELGPFAVGILCGAFGMIVIIAGAYTDSLREMAKSGVMVIDNVAYSIKPLETK